jgi:hypothetical protein
MGDLIGPGDLAAEGVDRTAWRWSEVPEGRRCWKQFKHTLVKLGNVAMHRRRAKA